MDSSINWVVGTFRSLTKCELYAMFQLRVAVFVVEQNCAYNEIDGQDHLDGTVHYLGYKDAELCCYARKLAPSQHSDAVRIGRVVVAQNHRGSGLATHLLQKMIADNVSVYPQQFVALSAQTSALGFYQQLGFIETSAMYLEDDIPHVDMLLSPKA